MKELKYGLQLIAILLAAFHGFLFKLSPPEVVRQSAAVGIASVLLLIVFLFITFLAGRHTANSRYRKWMCGVALTCTVLGTFAFFKYQAETVGLTFHFPPVEHDAELYVKGTVLTPAGTEWKALFPDKTDSELVDGAGGIANRDKVWTSESIGKPLIELTEYYVLF